VAAVAAVEANAFEDAREWYTEIEKFVVSNEAASMKESDIERELEKRGRELMRRLMQAHLDVRGPGEAAEGMADGADGVTRVRERLHERGLETVFGEVRVQRLGYGAEGIDSLHPLDAELNLPEELYSHEVRRRAAEEAAKDSFDEVVRTLKTATGAQVGKRQVEQLVLRAAADFDVFYEKRQKPETADAGTSILVITADGKGVVMRQQDLREKTRKKAEQSQHKLVNRLSRGEKRNAKRMATVAAVYTVAPYTRTAEQIVRGLAPHNEGDSQQRPRPQNKRVWASLEKTPEQVLTEAFGEAKRRDPEGLKTWVALVDGNETQIDILTKLFDKEKRDALIVLDFIHVAERVWKAALDLHPEGSPELQEWVTDRLQAILEGRSSEVAGGMRRSATLHQLDAGSRQRLDSCANYLLNYRPYLHYDQYLKMGLPIATGVVEGACRYLVKDRLDRTGARWSLDGAEAVLRLRALRTSGDFDEYWCFHEEQEYARNHVVRYAGGRVTPIRNRTKRHLKIVK
jgi:hypothetical protein